MADERTEQALFNAVESVVTEHQARLRAFLYSRLHDRETAEDFAQEIFLIVLKRGRELDFSRPMWPLLIGIAKNKIRQHWQVKTKELPIESLDRFVGERELRMLERHEATGFGEQRFEWLRQCLAKLAPAARKLLEITYAHGRRSEDVAALLGKKAGTIRVALHRVRGFLLNCIEQMEETCS